MNREEFEPVSIRLKWTSAVLFDVYTASRGGPSSARKKVLELLVVGGFVLIVSYAGFKTENLAFLVSLLCIAAFYFTRWWTIKRWSDGEMASRIRQGSTAVSLGHYGIDFSHPLSTAHFEWEAVQSIIDGKHALHLMLTPGMSLPIPYDALPSEITRKDLRQRVDVWRVDVWRVGGTV